MAKKILIIGNGFMGKRCADAWPHAILSDKKIESVKDMEDLLDEYKPDSVLNAAGVTGKPNVDWCETHQMETMLGNTVLPIMLAQACQKKNVYLLHMGSGCVFYGPSPDPRGWKETDFANPLAVYSRAKYAADLVLSTLPNVGIGRIRMPVDYISSRGNLIDKLASYKQVIDVENSVTVLDDMIMVFAELLEKQAPGIFHVTNPGTIKHKEIVALYEELVDPNHTNQWIKDEDLVAIGLAKKQRSNNFLQSENLEKLGIHMRPIKEAILDTMQKYAALKKA